MTRDLEGYGRTLPAVGWPGSARIAVSIAVHFQEGAERSTLDGDDDTESADGSSVAEGAVSEGRRRDLQIESLFEYGSRRGFWRLYGILASHGVKASYLACGLALERNPVAAQAIAEAGHEVVAHGYRWIPQVAMSRREEAAEIARALAAAETTTGQQPTGWCSRQPSPNTRALLLEHGLAYDSDSYGDDLPYFVEVGGGRILTVPHSMDANDYRFWMTPQAAGFTNPHHFLAVLRGTFDWLYAEGATRPRMMSVGLHPRISGRPSRARQLDRFIAYAKGFPDVWFAPRGEIARCWIAAGGD